MANKISVRGEAKLREDYRDLSSMSDHYVVLNLDFQTSGAKAVETEIEIPIPRATYEELKSSLTDANKDSSHSSPQRLRIDGTLELEVKRS